MPEYSPAVAMSLTRRLTRQALLCSMPKKYKPFRFEKNLAPSHNNRILLEMVQSSEEVRYGNASRIVNRVATLWCQPGNVESCNSLMFLTVFGTSCFPQEAKAALPNSRQCLGFEDVAFSRKESISLLVFERGQSIVGKILGHWKDPSMGVKHCPQVVQLRSW